MFYNDFEHTEGTAMGETVTFGRSEFDKDLKDYINSKLTNNTLTKAKIILLLIKIYSDFF